MDHGLPCAITGREEAHSGVEFHKVMRYLGSVVHWIRFVCEM